MQKITSTLLSTGKSLSFFILILATVVVVSGCDKKQTVNNQGQGQENKNQQQENPLKEEIKYLPNGEVDTSDWKTYRNDYYKMEIKYPPFLKVSDSEKKSFGFDLKVDPNYYYYFGEIIYFDEMGLKELKSRMDYCIKYYSDQPGFEEIKIKNGYIYYYIQKTKGGYTPSVTILWENGSLWGSTRVEDRNSTLENYNPKYIDIFKASLKTIKFDD